MRFCILLTLLVSSMVQADRVYIDDVLYVPLRGGQSTDHQILHRGLKSGTELERLEVNEETNYTRVRTDSGLEGWIRSQYISEEPVAEQVLDSVSDRLENLEAEHQQSLLRLREAREDNETLSSDVSSLREENESLASELKRINELAANVIAIDEENDRLVSDRSDLVTEIEGLNQANQELASSRAQEWFLAGGGTVLIGLLFGFWIARRLYHRRNTSGWA